jgi:outer membrane lipoprotein SlyB
MFNDRFNIISSLALVASLTGCAAGDFGSPNVYQPYEVARAGSLESCTVLRTRPVLIDANPSDSGLGAAVGATTGVLLGAQVRGHRHDRSLVELVLGVAGGMIGQSIAVVSSRRDGLEIAARMADGRVLVVVQPADQAFMPGEQAYLVSSYSGLCITH